MIEIQASSGDDSGSGLKDVFSRIVGAARRNLGEHSILNASCLNTKLGPMIAIASDLGLYLLEFIDRRGLDREVERLSDRTQSAITPGRTAVITSIEKELALYFDGKLNVFNTPLLMLGSPFQQQVWNTLMKIPFGETRSYRDIATALGRPTASRAVALANAANQLAIVIPCHRVISANGTLSGYAGGVARKASLIDLEKMRR